MEAAEAAATFFPFFFAAFFFAGALVGAAFLAEVLGAAFLAEAFGAAFFAALGAAFLAAFFAVFFFAATIIKKCLGCRFSAVFPQKGSGMYQKTPGLPQKSDLFYR